MKKILCLVIVIMLMLFCAGCGNMKTVEDMKEDIDGDSMFVLVEKNYLWNKYHIVYHKETKVMYAVSSTTIFTVMLDADGKPLLWEG